MSQCAADPTALRVIIGNYHQDANAKSNDFEGFDGDLNGLRIILFTESVIIDKFFGKFNELSWSFI